MSKKDSFATPWKKLAQGWEYYYREPGRPSAQDQNNYARFIRRALKGHFGKALVLGATPEIRNVLHKFPVEVTVLDITLEMILAMNEFVPKAGKDILMRGDWVSNPLASDYYDVILGDFVWANVARQKWPNFLSTVRRLLKPGGYFIQRVYVLPDNWRVEPTADVVARYGSLPPIRQRASELLFHLLMNSYSKKEHGVSMKRVWSLLNPFWSQGKFRVSKTIPGGKLLKEMYNFWGKANKKWQFGTVSEQKKIIAPYFSVVDETLAQDYLCNEVGPMWLCKVKK